MERVDFCCEPRRVNTSHISGNPHKKACLNPPEIQELMKPAWVNENVNTGHGSLAALTPQKYIGEGDIPSFLHLVNNGLAAHLDYTLGGWGGRSAFDDPTFPNHITDKTLTDDGDRNKMYWRWVPAVQNDSAARLDWCVADDFKKASHNPVAVLNGDQSRSIIKLTAKVGETITLSSTGSADPDGNVITSHWMIYREAGTLDGGVKLTQTTGNETSLTIPQPGRGSPKSPSFHVILTIEDNGTPSLVAYRRALITPRTNEIHAIPHSIPRFAGPLRRGRHGSAQAAHYCPHRPFQ